MSTDSKHANAAFATSLGGMPFPILTDFYPHGKIAQSFGLFNEHSGAFKRSVVIIDKKGIVRFKKTYISAADLKVEDILAELDKLKK